MGLQRGLFLQKHVFLRLSFSLSSAKYTNRLKDPKLAVCNGLSFAEELVLSSGLGYASGGSL